MTKPFPSDLEIAQAATLEPITEIAAENGISADRLEPTASMLRRFFWTKPLTPRPHVSAAPNTLL